MKIPTPMRCGYCFKVIDHVPVYFSSYVLHIIDDDDAKIPVFCDGVCMLKWAAIKKGISMEAIELDFDAYVHKIKW